MPRAGTTFLYHYLQQHPSIFLPFRKEIDFFNDLYHFKGTDWFERLYREMKEGQMGGDLSPACWHDPRAIEYIKEYNPDAKVILSLRDPAEFAVSLYMQKNHSHYDVPPSIEEWMEEGYESKLTKGGGSVFFRFDNAEFDERAESYREAFGENLLIYDFSFFKRNQLTVLQAIEDFLGLEPHFNESNFDNLRINASYRRNIKWLYAITAQEWFRDFFEKYVPRKWAMGARSAVDRMAVAGEPSENASKLKLTPEDVSFAQERLQRSCDKFRALFKDYPMFTGDGKEFKTRTKEVETVA